jgi:hypothetical protein
VVSFAQSNSTANDTLIAGPSGAGYTYPGTFYRGVDGETNQANRSYMYAEATSELMSACSMNLITIIDGAPSFESVQPLLDQVHSENFPLRIIDRFLSLSLFYFLFYHDTSIYYYLSVS